MLAHIRCGTAIQIKDAGQLLHVDQPAWVLDLVADFTIGLVGGGQYREVLRKLSKLPHPVVITGTRRKPCDPTKKYYECTRMTLPINKPVLIQWRTNTG
jgi:hypothetical protein